MDWDNLFVKKVKNVMHGNNSSVKQYVKISKILNTQHHELYVKPKMAIDLISKLPKIYDEPFGDSSAIPTLLVSKYASQDVKVVLSADGGDEIFGGYHKYISAMKAKKKINLLPNFLKNNIHNVHDILYHTNLFQA